MPAWLTALWRRPRAPRGLTDAQVDALARDPRTVGAPEASAAVDLALIELARVVARKPTGRLAATDVWYGATVLATQATTPQQRRLAVRYGLHHAQRIARLGAAR